MFLFPLMENCLELEKFREKSVVLAFGFLARAYRLPSDEYELVQEKDLTEAVNILAENYEGAFG